MPARLHTPTPIAKPRRRPAKRRSTVTVPHAVEIATALYVGVFNIRIALGAWGGGRLLDGVGLHANLWVAAVFAMAALLLVATTRRQIHAVRG